MSGIIPVIIATAGHVDHGKTALVEALTGCNTDRLPQEKARGLSIDIGFAPCILARGESAGIVDLPGHEDFIKNMTAGAATADILLLVVAANESVMPQTKEHLQIVAQLTSARVVLVITKTDLVDREYLEIVREDAEKLLSGFGMVPEQVHYTSVKDFSGISGLREGLYRLAHSFSRADDKRDFRVFVERTFLVKGHGTVVTGVPVSGKVAVGDSLRLNGRPVRVRGLESYGSKIDFAESGRCLAINVDYADAGSGRKTVERGDVLCAGSYSESADFIVRVENISDSYIFTRVTKCRVHTGTMALNASVKLYGCSELGAGESGFAHLKLEETAVLAAGDRFLLRIASPYGNIAGGVILSSEGDYRLSSRDRFRNGLYVEAYSAVAGGRYLLAEILAGGRNTVSRSDLELLAHIAGDVLQSMITGLVEDAALQMLCKDFWAVSGKIPAAAEAFYRKLQQYHAENSFRTGMDYELAAVCLEVPVSGVERYLKILGRHIGIVFSDGTVAAADFETALAGNALSMYRVVRESVEKEPQFWLALGELREKCQVSSREAHDVVRILLSEKALAVVAGKYLVSSAEIERLRICLDNAFEEIEVLDISSWRKYCGLSRNYAVAALEYFDSVKLCVRVESGRKKANNT